MYTEKLVCFICAPASTKRNHDPHIWHNCGTVLLAFGDEIRADIEVDGNKLDYVNLSEYTDILGIQVWEGNVCNRDVQPEESEAWIAEYEGRWRAAYPSEIGQLFNTEPEYIA